MLRVVTMPPEDRVRPDGTSVGGWWEESEDGRVLCKVCPRGCSLAPGDRGFCFVRQNRGGQLVSTTYGRSTGFCIDPIEKKPLHHFYPGSPVLSFGTAGCNLGCKFCQNWTTSRSRDVEAGCERAAPGAIAEAARATACRSVAFTYNDPIVWAEYAIDTARACHAAGHQDGGGHLGLHERGRPRGFLRAHRRRQRRPEGLHAKTSTASWPAGSSSRCSIRCAGSPRRRRSGWRSPTW